MNKKELTESINLLNDVLNDIAGAVPSSDSGAAGSQMNYDFGQLRANAGSLFIAGTIGDPLNQCFSDVTAAGATLSGMIQALQSISALATVTNAGLLFVNLCIILTLVQIANIIAATTFTSRNEVETLITQVSALFDSAIETAADSQASDVYLNLVTLHAQVVQYLVTNEQPLPFIVQYQAQRSMPSLLLAMRLYGDVNDVESLADQLVDENQVVDPCFMPLTGVALSSP